MALNIEVGHVTVPGSTGNFDLTLPANFDPKAIILVAVPCAADGVVANAAMSIGFGTYRGSSVQQHYTTVFTEDNAGTSDTYRETNQTSLVVLLDAAGVVDLEIDLVSMTTGSGSKVTLNAINLHTTASVRLNYIVFGGDDVLDAQAHDITLTTGAGAQDITLGSGFGHPSVVFFQRVAAAMGDGIVSGADVGIGWGILAGDDRSVWFGSADNAASSASFHRNDTDSALVAGGGGTIETDITLAAEAGFPTDGYEITKATSSFASETTKGLALKFSGDVTITSGEGAARTTSGDTDHAVGTSTPKGLIMLHTRATTANTTVTSGGDAAGLGIGLLDGSGNERWAGVADDDQAATMVTSSGQSATKALQFLHPNTKTIDGAADGTVSGSNFRLSWATPAPSAFLYEWIAFGETGATGLAGTVASASTVAGALTVTAGLAGAVAAQSGLAGTLSFQGLAGTVAAQSTVAGALTVTAPLTGTVAAQSNVTGALSVTTPGAGIGAPLPFGLLFATASAPGALAGTISSASTVAGALTVTAGLAGTPAGASAVTGTLTVTAGLTATVAGQSTVTGALTVTASLAGTVASASTVTGTLTNTPPGNNDLAGTIASASTVTGALTVTAPLASTVAGASTVTGALTVTAGLAGAPAGQSTVTGTLTVTARLAGTISSASTVTGSLTNTPPGSVTLAGTIAGSSTVTGQVVVARPLAGTAASSSSLSGTLTSLAGLAAAVTSASTVTGALTIRHPLAGAITGASTVTGQVVVIRPLAGTIAGVSVVSATLTNQGPVTQVPRLEGGATVTVPEGTGTAAVSESTGGVLALIE